MEKLYSILNERGDYVGSFEDFENDYAKDNYKELHSKLSEANYYTNSHEDFVKDYKNVSSKKSPTETDAAVEEVKSVSDSESTSVSGSSESPTNDLSVEEKKKLTFQERKQLERDQRKALQKEEVEDSGFIEQAGSAVVKLAKTLAPMAGAAVSIGTSDKARAVGKSLVSKTGKGIAKFGKGLSEEADSMIFAGMNAYANSFGGEGYSREEKIALRDAIANGFYSPKTGVTTKGFEDLEDFLNEGVRKTENESVTKALQAGNYAEAAELTVGGGLESLPSIAAAFYGYGAIAVFGASTAGNKFNEEFEKNPDEALGTLYANAAGNGIIESAYELVTNKLLMGAGLIGKTSGAKAAKDYLAKGAKALMRQGWGLTKGLLYEGASEGATEVTSMLWDNFDAIGVGVENDDWKNTTITKTKDEKGYLGSPSELNPANYKLGESIVRVMDATIIGGVTGGTITSIGAIKNPSSRARAETLLTDFDTKRKLQAAVQDISSLTVAREKTTDPETQAYLDEQIKKIEQSVFVIKKNNSRVLNSMTQSELEEQFETINEIEKTQIALSDKTLDKRTSAGKILKKDLQDLRNKKQEQHDKVIERQQIKDIETAANIANDISAKGVESLTTIEIKEQFPDMTLTPEQSENGFLAPDGRLIINKDAIARTKNINTGAHELLHNIVKRIAKFDPQILEEFKAVLKSKGQLEAVEKRINAVDGKGERLYDDNYLKNNPDEFLTQFSEAIADGDIRFDETLGQQLETVLAPALRFAGFKPEAGFGSGKAVYEFMKSYQSSIKNGKLNTDIEALLKDTTDVEVNEKTSSKSKESEELESIYETKGIDGANEIIKNPVVQNAVNKILNKYENVPGFERQLLKDEMETGKGGILELINSYPAYVTNFKPTPAKKNPAPLAGYINKSFGTGKDSFKKYINIAKRNLGEEFTVDIDQASAIVAEETAEDTILAKEDKPKSKPTKASKLLSKENLNKAVKAISKVFPNIPTKNLTFKKLGNLIPDIIANEIGIPVKKITNPAANLSKSEATKIQQFITKNIDVIKRILPEGAVLTAATEKLIGTSTGVSKALLAPFYTKSDRLTRGAGLSPYTKNKNITTDQIFKAAGIIDGKKSTDFSPRSPEAQVLKAIANLSGKLISSEIARQQPGISKETKQDIGAGKAETMFSREAEELTSIELESASDLIGDILDGELTDFYDEKGNLLPKYSKKVSKRTARLIHDDFKFGDFNDKEAQSFTKLIINNSRISQKIKDEFNNRDTFSRDKDAKDSLAESILTIAKDFGKPIMDVLGFDIFGYYNRALDPASRKETIESIAARKKVRDENKIRKKDGIELLPNPKIVYQENIVGDYFNKLQNTKGAIKNTTSDASILEILGDVRKMNKSFTLFKKIDKVFAEPDLNKKRKMMEKLAPEIEAANEANIKLATYVSQSLNKLYRSGKISAANVITIYQLQTSTTSGLRALSRLTQVTLESGVQKGITKGEHLAPNANTMAEIVGFTLDTSINEIEANDLIEDAFSDHNQWYTQKKLTDIIDKRGGTNNTSNEARLLFLDKSDLKNVYNVNGNPFVIERIIDRIKEIANKKAAPINRKILGEANTLSKEATNEELLDEMANIDETSKENERVASKEAELGEEFNRIIEGSTGIGKDKRYSRVKAEVVGASKGRFNFFIPPSAEDFVGLLYKTLGKGKVGNDQMAWYKAHLLNPYAGAMDNISRARVALMNDFKALKKELKIVPKTLKKKLPGENFTQEQAVRVYIWDKQGMTIPGMAGTDIKSLVDFIQNNNELVAFADQLIAMQKGDQYAFPDEGWLAGNITTDLIQGINTTTRSKYLEVWQQNADEIFTEANLNKLEAAYGKNYKVALENILQRMKTGKNRSFGGDTLTGRVTDWLTNSIGAIMFFNTRSAVLQTISAINFINFGDNNIYAAGKAFANQPQYWKDFKTLFNSDFLVERRDGLKLNVNEADIAEMAKKGGVKGVISELLRLGFLPTQLADSFAIASGGSTFYRNRLKALEKQGMSKKDAEAKAFQDFREKAEESQQSSRPDRISQQQAGPLGRIILAFANTPAQYARIIKKAASDIKNGRGDTKTNVSKIIYYGVAQNLIFNALQQALFGLAFGDEEEEEKVKEKKYVNVANGMADSLLRGMGLGGAVFSVLKNTALRLNQESDKKSPKYQDVLQKEILQISPPISSKVGKLRAAGRSYSWNKKEMMEKGWSIDNPAYLAAGQVIAATTNIPLDRAFKKIENIRNASNSDLQAWQRIASAAGWSKWELGIQDSKKDKKSTYRKRKNKKKKTNF